jgi:CheY-like chemotaxis protein
VDDNPIILEGVCAMLQRYRYPVLTAADSAEALTLWQRHRATLRAVVADYHLGKGRTGISLLREMSVVQPSLVLVLTSASVTPDVLAELSRTSPVHALPKPYHYIQLLRLLRSSLDATPARRLEQMRRSVDSTLPDPPNFRLDR